MKRILNLNLIASILACTYVITPATASAKSFTCPHLDDNTKVTQEKMVQGKDGWFFRREADLRENFTIMPETKKLFTRMNTALNKAGTQWVFIPVPVRGLSGYAAMDRSEPFQSAFNEKLSSESFATMLETLRSTGMTVPNLLTASQSTTGDKPFYFKRDHHWTDWGSSASAEAVATALKDNPVYQNQAKVKFTSTPKYDVQLKAGLATELQRICNEDLPPEPLKHFTTQLNAEGEDALFGDVGGEPSVLVGTSFSAVPHFNFGGFLSEKTGLNISNRSISGGGIYNALISYTSSKQFEKTKPPLLFWETPSNYDINTETPAVMRQVIPAVHGVCKGGNVVANNTIKIQNGVSTTLFSLPAEKNVSLTDYYIFIDAADRAFNQFTLIIDYDDEDGEWFTIDRSDRFDNEGRFFIELNDEIESNVVKIGIDNMPNINATLNAKICKKS